MAKKIRTILTIDDEISSLHILNNMLKDENYRVLTATDGVQGLRQLEKSHETIDLILLDRMMPNMNGLELLRHIKRNPNMSDIPVIMQTSASSKAEILEGIESGAYYYLIKPLNKEILRSLVSSAINDYDTRKLLRQEVSKQKKYLKHIKHCELELTTITEANELSVFLANFYPNPQTVVFGISELLVNAVEHGSLGLTYQDKSELIRNNTLFRVLEDLQKLPNNRNKRVQVRFDNLGSDIFLRIKDEGRGFSDWKRYLNLSPDIALESHGRGIALSRKISFDSIEYLGCGNEVLCKVHTR